MRRAGEWRCPFTGQRAEELHHPTGRVEGAYADPTFQIPLALAQHNLEHAALRAAGIGEDAQGPHVTLRLRRAGHLFVRLGTHCPGSDVVVIPDFVVVEQGLFLMRVADEIEPPR